METKRVTHPVDLQDREGFLRFLSDQARQGWAVQEIGAFSSVFQKTDTPPKGYTMSYHRDTDWEYENQEGYHVLPCSVEGFLVYPTDEIVLADPTWPEQVLDDFVKAPNLALANRFRSTPLILPLVILGDIVGCRLGFEFISDLPLYGPMFWVLLAFCLVAVSGAVLMVCVEDCHEKGLRAARERKTVYRPSEGLTRLTWLKNRLVRVQTALSVLTFVLFLVFSGITSGSIQL